MKSLVSQFDCNIQGETEKFSAQLKMNDHLQKN